ncbi:hypothetical protein ACIBCA_18710 [Kitasatospora sp. NPDC051170]|uniref:TRAFAC clade GTPase domain-containing protein n=1 Tax=Kitasatospora sp. NPDC051170 TaxID=3364056 RepID=UPI0037908052
MTPAARWLCPSCLERIGRADVGYRCTSGDARCAGDRRLKAADPLAPPAVCGTCRRTTARQFCRRCKKRLPNGYLRHPARTVALLGPPGAGRSTLVTVLLHELRHRLGEELGLALVAGDDRTGAEVARHERRLYEEGRLPPRTAPPDGSPPLVHRLTRAGGRRERALTLVLLDESGRNPVNGPTGLGNADAVILVLDPQHLDPQRLPGAGTPSGLDQALGPVLDRLLDALTPQDGRVRVPVATVLAKLDLLTPTLLPDSVLRRRRAPGARFDPVDRATVDAELRALLELWQAGALVRHLDDLCTDHQLFALSALGAAPRGGAMPPEGPLPHRVEDPLLWLLHRFGFLDGLRSGR